MADEYLYFNKRNCYSKGRRVISPYHFSSFAQRGLVLSKKNKWSWHLVHLDRVIMHVPALTLIVISLHYIFISLTGQLSCLYKHLTYVQYNYHKYIWK